MDWKEISNLSLYSQAELEHAKRENIALDAPPVDHTQLPREILARLKPHYSNWSLMKDNGGLRELRASDSIMLFEKSGDQWLSVTNFGSGTQLGKNAWALSRRSLRPARGSGSGRGGEAAGALGGLAALLPEAQLVPTVFITSPSPRAEIELHDKQHTKQDFQNHTFKEGDTVLSVVEELTGRKDSKAIYNYNNPPFSPRRPPQAMDTVRVAVGRSLKVSGTTSNSNSVTLSWTGPTSGSKSIGVPKAGKNEIVGWETEFKVKAGVYHLTATVTGAKSETDVALYGYEDEMLVFYFQLDIQGEKAKDDRVLLTSADGEWEQILEVGKLKSQNGWVELAFPKPENAGPLTMYYDAGNEEESFIIFKDEQYDSLLAATNE